MPRIEADPTVALLRQSLTRSARQVSAVASNLANVDTPGYRAKEVMFSTPVGHRPAIRLEATRPGHIVLGGGADEGFVTDAPALRVRQDGNTVDVDREMTRLGMLQGRYRAAVEMVRKRFALLLYAATDGRSGG